MPTSQGENIAIALSPLGGLNRCFALRDCKCFDLTGVPGHMRMCERECTVCVHMRENMWSRVNVGFVFAFAFVSVVVCVFVRLNVCYRACGTHIM